MLTFPSTSGIQIPTYSCVMFACNLSNWLFCLKPLDLLEIRSKCHIEDIRLPSLPHTYVLRHVLSKTESEAQSTCAIDEAILRASRVSWPR